MRILDIRFDNFPFATATASVLSFLENDAKASVFFINADCLWKAQHDAVYAQILNSTEVVLPDGIGLKMICGLLMKKKSENCNGTDFCPLLLYKAAQRGYKVFFLGGKADVAEKAATEAIRKFPGLQVVGSNTGFFADDEPIIKKINSSNADILFVSMGVPLQEKWIAKNREGLAPRLCLGVGAFLDYLSGSIPRAPRVFRFLHLEWLWRIFIDPRRMIQRYIVDGWRLFFLVLRKKVYSYI
jgi:N-acetylglucosaminyldiphosphoundecaprenol N-acetyl-beta-D-mannosaminyltransferase